jgi:hypothetical protein
VKRHDTDVVSFTAGALFLAIGLAYLLPEVSDIRVATRWVVPALLIGLGLCGLLAAFTSRPAGARAGQVTGLENRAEPYANLESEPYPDLTLDLAEELAKTRAQSVAQPLPRPGGSHAINPDPPRDHPSP